eukprot:Gb_07463 [translate_table: standard]
MAGYSISMARIGVVLLVLVAFLQVGLSQKCGCAKGECCSQWGYCGKTKAYCGDGCQSGPCTVKPVAGSVASLITTSFFSQISAGISNSCKGKRFYTYNSFITAAKSFPSFGNTGSNVYRKRELAAFFANVAHETGSLCYIDEINGPPYCSPSKQWPCVKGKSYHGRGPLQLTGNANYGAAGKYFGFNGLSNPEKVVENPTIAFKSAIWYWMINSRCHQAMSPSGVGFAGTIRSINIGECNGHFPKAVASRVDLYKKFCSRLGVTTGSNLYC